MLGETYAFIDGGHLRRHYKEAMRSWSGTDGDLVYERIKANLGAQKVFYYDCLDDIRGNNEPIADFEKRKKDQEDYFNKIQRNEATHVRLGSMTGTAKNKRQKRVDILLAVEMMNHAVRRNMTTAALITGDQDFLPLEEALIDMGLHVRVLGDRQHTSGYLADAADYFLPLNLTEYHNWSSQKFKTRHPIPGRSIGNPTLNDHTFIKSGTVNDITAELFKSPSGTFILRMPHNDDYMICSFQDETLLIKFCEMELGPVVW